MAPRVTLHGPPGGHKPSHIAPNTNTAKGKERVSAPVVDASSGDEAMAAASDETDELADDVDDPNTVQPQWETISSTAPGKAVVKKPRPKPPTVRTPGQPLVSMSRVDTIVNADPTTGPMSREAVFIVALAAEDFIRRLTRVAHSRSKHDSRALTTYSDFADTAHYFPEFNFLKDTMPRTVTMKEAMVERELAIKRREALLNGLDPDAVEISKENGVAKRSLMSENGKTTTKTGGHSESVDALSGRSEQQKNKKPRLSRSEGAKIRRGLEVTGRSISVTSNSGRSSISAAPDSSNSAGNTGVKIRIRARAKPSPPPASSLEHSSADQTPQSDDEVMLEPDETRTTSRSNTNGRASAGLLPIAPVAVGSDRPPLWTNVPLPPPPSPRTPKQAENGHHARGREQRSVPAAEAGLKIRTAGQHIPPHLVEKTPVNLRELVASNAQNPGRTIYSQR